MVRQIDRRWLVRLGTILKLKGIVCRQTECHLDLQIAWITFLAVAAKMREYELRIISCRFGLPQDPVEAARSAMKMMCPVVFVKRVLGPIQSKFSLIEPVSKSANRSAKVRSASQVAFERIITKNHVS